MPAPAIQPTAMPATPRYAALPYGDEPVMAATNYGHGGLASVLENRCANCHKHQAQGGVKLWNDIGQFAPARNGIALSRGQIYKTVVVEHRMPRGGSLNQFELSAMEELLN